MAVVGYSFDRTPRSLLGGFDEDTCRLILQEIGELIVPRAPFDYGMDEVVFILFYKYGERNIADALSVLDDILNEEDPVAGHGDVSDVWRQWRRDWKHRNVRSM